MERRHKILIALATAGMLVAALVAYWNSAAARATRLADSADPAHRLEAVALLHGDDGGRALKILVRLSEDDELDVAVVAVKALGSAAGQRRQAALAEIASGSPRPAVRAAAAGELGRFEQTPTETLTALLADKDPVVRAGAARGLVRKEDLAAMTALLTAMDDPDETVRREAMTAAFKTMGTHYMYRPDAPRSQRLKILRLMKSDLDSGRVRKANSGE